ncbi:MAG: DUF512 domain-containing protein [Candidatus Cloacimonetes bacterium]|nr:DUF512 domain-containing protein [Candidatus Cloacimonadota bacterium]
MSLRIVNVLPDSLGEDSGLQAGFKILSINHHPVNDYLDLQFYSAEPELEIIYQDLDQVEHTIRINQDWQKPLGIETQDQTCITCANNCIFCFVDQMPPGFRKTLYIKDDDYRLSFVYGNFITLTNIAQFHRQRILNQKLSPLYISVHTTNPDLHRRLLRYNHEFNIVQALQEIIQADIKLHTQIVIVPGWNDRAELERTLHDLHEMGDNILSIGIVPVGLTAFRKDLTGLQPVQAEDARVILQAAAPYPRTYCADEIFLLAGRDIPRTSYYDDFPQLENGIGMLRLFFNNWTRRKKKFLREVASLDYKLVFITGKLAAASLQKIADEVNLQIPGKIRVAPVENNMLGKSVTVTGLLAAGDIFAQVELQEDEIAVLSEGILNDNYLTLDDADIETFKGYYGKPVMLIDEEFRYWNIF